MSRVQDRLPSIAQICALKDSWLCLAWLESKFLCWRAIEFALSYNSMGTACNIDAGVRDARSAADIRKADLRVEVHVTQQRFHLPKIVGWTSGTMLSDLLFQG